MRLIPIFALTFALSSYAQGPPSPPQTATHPVWALHWSSGKGNFWTDQPDCHPLQYFSTNPKRFDYGQDLFGRSPTDIKDKVEEKRIGEVQGFSIHQILHTIPIEGWNLFIKMILVERRPGEFCEIYNAEYDAVMGSIDPAYIVEINSEKVLVTHDLVSGTGNFYVEEYWTFDNQGPIPLDQGIIDETLKKLLPKEKSVWKGGGFDIGKMCYAQSVWQDGDGNCCPSAGKVQIKFALENHQLVVVQQKYDSQLAEKEKEKNPTACTL